MFLFDYAPIRRVQGHLGPLHPTTGVPMEAVVLAETEDGRTLMVNGSYHAEFRLNDKLIVTDRDTYFFDTVTATLRTGAGVVPIDPEQANLRPRHRRLPRRGARGAPAFGRGTDRAAGDAGAAGRAG